MSLRDKLLPRELEYFATLYEKKAFSPAANAIPMSYQGLKKAVDSLEKTLGVPLFTDDAGGRLVFTEYAEELYSLVSRWNHDADNLETTFDDLSKRTRVYRLPAVNGTLAIFSNKALDGFKSRHPHWELNLTERPDSDIDRMLSAGECDTAITAAPYASEFDTVPLFRTRLCAWVNKTHPFAGRASLTIEDLEGQKVMFPNESFKSYRVLHDALEEFHVVPAAIEYSNGILEPYNFALRGKGISLTNVPAARMLRAASEVTAIPFEGLSYELGFSCRRGYHATEEDEEVLAFLEDYAERLMKKQDPLEQND